tara:strand:+ start:915 stop:1256 length:342 start_codon:yes stop_codon:yes gene_type:complete
VHRGELGHCGTLYEKVHRLRLIDETTPICGHVNDTFLTNFPYSFIKFFDIFGDIDNILDRPTSLYHEILHLLGPETNPLEIIDEMLIDYNKFTSEGASQVDVGRVGFETLVIT